MHHYVVTPNAKDHIQTIYKFMDVQGINFDIYNHDIKNDF